MRWRSQNNKIVLSWPNHCTLWPSSWWTTNDWNSYYFVKLVRWKNNNKNPNASHVRWVDFELSWKWKIWLSENSLLLSRSCIWRIFLLTGKKIYIRTKKINFSSVLCKLLFNHSDRYSAPQRLYSQRYIYRWRNNSLLKAIP